MLSGEFSRTGKPILLAVITGCRAISVRSSSNRDGSKCEGSRQISDCNDGSVQGDDSALTVVWTVYGGVDGVVGSSIGLW